MMNPFSPFGNSQFDPSKMDPKVLMELSQLIQQLPPDRLNRMQTLMHNMMAGYDVRKEMEEFEKNLPPGFREKLMSVMASQYASAPASQAAPIEVEASSTAEASVDMNIREARMTILRAVAAGHMTPEDAERLLFKE
jgi:hypothetical protein